MSDFFFDSLVARARGLEPELVPRVPSLFEVPAVGGPLEDDPVESVVDTDVRRHNEPSYAVPRRPEQLRVPPRPESGAAVRPAIPRTADRVTEAERHVVLETVAAGDLESAGRSRETLSPRLEHGPAPVPVQTSVDAGDAHSRAPTRLHERGLIPAGSVDASSVAMETTTQPSIRTVPASSELRPEAQAAVDAGDAHSPAPTRLHEPGLIPAGSVDASSVAVKATTQTSIRSEPTSSELRLGSSQRVRAAAFGRQPDPSTTAPTVAEPTIHVTIGRVEIRAIPEAAPAQVPRTGRPRTQSLDEYLAERNQRRQA
jgi:hypothetical protein